MGSSWSANVRSLQAILNSLRELSRAEGLSPRLHTECASGARGNELIMAVDSERGGRKLTIALSARVETRGAAAAERLHLAVFCRTNAHEELVYTLEVGPSAGSQAVVLSFVKRSLHEIKQEAPRLLTEEPRNPYGFFGI